MMQRTLKTSIVSVLWMCLSFAATPALVLRAELRAGAVAIDITPATYPVAINGGMTANSASAATTPIHARAIVLDDGKSKIAIVVVDSCMMSRGFLDEAKSLASQKTGIPANHMLISATHAHSVPASMGCLGTDADPAYIPYLRIKLVEAIERAMANLEPAQVGWSVKDAANYTAVRQWVRRPDRLAEDPFGNKTVRANMHAGRVWDDVTGEAGPEDPDLSLLSIQALDGRPIAILGNFSMHYFSGEKPVSADYFGRFSEGLKKRFAKSSNGKPEFVGIMSHGCSGDIWRMDYTKQTPEKFNTIKIEEYTEGLLDIATDALKNITYDRKADLAMEESRLHLNYRVPDKQRLQWAQGVVEKMGDRLPKTTEEVYAREQLMLHEWQSTDVVVQAVRIGSNAIATTPTETYALTGLKLKKQSPLSATMVIELANGGDGYIPPPEQHPLGGYNTWAARSAGLEVEAEHKITEACLELLEKVCNQPRKSLAQSQGPAAQEILSKKPIAYWRLDEVAGPRAKDLSGSNLDGIYEPGVLFYLAGPDKPRFCNDNEVNRAVHLAGGRMRARVPGLGDNYSVSLWIWNGMPADGRDVSGWFFARSRDHATTPQGEALGIAGIGQHAGRLQLQVGKETFYGKKAIERWTWENVRFVRSKENVKVYIGNETEPEIDVRAPSNLPSDAEELFFGGNGNKQFSWEGRIDEIAVFRQ